MNNYQDIINGLRKNDERLQMQFYDMFAASTYQSAFAILGDSREAEEIMQDSILKAFTKTSLINDDENQMRKTLRRIAINAAIDILRKRKNYLEINEADIDFIDENDDEEIKFTTAHIKQAIQSLAVGYRAILSLHLFENMNFNQISEQLKISQNTVRSQYSRALLKLRSHLKNNTNE
jgi:RNA polymerase sigma-70 factor (ECF subfamily)